MIKIKNAHKYFNKGKLHVINDTTLTLMDNGLVALLGPSGCGKTTLLNVIGGLDKIKKGSIYIDDMKMSSKIQNKVDKLRNAKVGYIFQDYKLIDNMTVFDNVALVLTMLGIKDKNEIKERVEYVLDKVGMLRYRKRPASMLSGGEKQRVGIARAIVKNPDIILADEPTGNLDSRNSLEIMKIIKAISKDRLVILVTHEQSLAKFYASRIVEIVDGKIVNDYINDHTEELDYEIENSFYLKDFKHQRQIEGKSTTINIYSNDEKPLNVDIVLKNGNIYIKSNTTDKIEEVDETSSIEFINEHYKKIAKSDIDKYNFDIKEIKKRKYSSILNPFKLIIQGFEKVLDFSIMKKILLCGFLISAIFISYAVDSIYARVQVREEDFVKTNKEYISVIDRKISLDKYASYENSEYVNYVIPGDSSVTFNMKNNDYYQTMEFNSNISGSLASTSIIKKENLIYGKMPENNKEIVIDEFVLKKEIKNNVNYNFIGVKEPKDFIDKVVTITNLGEFKIVGVSNTKSPSIYASKDLFYDIIYNQNIDGKSVMNYELFKDNIQIKEGRIPSNDYEVIVNIDNKEIIKLNKEIDSKVNGKKLVVVGYYTSSDDYNYFFTNPNTIKMDIITTTENMSIYPINKQNVLNKLKEDKTNYSETYKDSKDEYLKAQKESIKSTMITSFIIMGISLIEILFMIRSSFLSRIREIGIYRAVGVKKSDIYKMFTGEIIAITTIGSVPGVLLMNYIIKSLVDFEEGLNSFVMYDTQLMILTIIFIYIFNLVIGLFPVYNVIKHRPAEILARTDNQ